MLSWRKKIYSYINAFAYKNYSFADEFFRTWHWGLIGKPTSMRRQISDSMMRKINSTQFCQCAMNIDEKCESRKGRLNPTSWKPVRFSSVSGRTDISRFVPNTLTDRDSFNSGWMSCAKQLHINLTHQKTPKQRWVINVILCFYNWLNKCGNRVWFFQSKRDENDPLISRTLTEFSFSQ